MSTIPAVSIYADYEEEHGMVQTKRAKLPGACTMWYVECPKTTSLLCYASLALPLDCITLNTGIKCICDNILHNIFKKIAFEFCAFSNLYSFVLERRI